MGCIRCPVDEVQKKNFDSPRSGLMQNGSYSCLRYAFFVFNCLIWFGSCGLLGAGIWLRVAHGNYANLLPHLSLFSFNALLISVGAVTFLTAFFGCCGAWCQNQISLLIYLVLVVIVTLVELGIVTLLFLYHDGIRHSFQHELKRGIQLHYNSTNDADFDGLAEVWDDLQTKFECCGVNSYKDWFHVSAWVLEDQIPVSCCRPEVLAEDSCRTIDPLPSEIFTDGCYPKVQDWLLERLHLIGIAGLVLAFFQLFGLVSSVLLCCTLRGLAVQAAPYSPYKAYAD